MTILGDLKDQLTELVWLLLEMEYGEDEIIEQVQLAVEAYELDE